MSGMVVYAALASALLLGAALWFGREWSRSFRYDPDWTAFVIAALCVGYSALFAVITALILRE